MKIYTPVLSVLEEAHRDGMVKGLDAVLERSNELAPEFSGDLKVSGQIDVEDLTGRVSYDSPGYHYILDQHENLEFEHPNGGQAKFLETAAAEVDVTKYIADEVRQRFGG